MRTVSFICAMLGWVIATAAHGGIVLVHAVTIDFRDELDASAKADWTQNERLDITDEGLGWSGEPTSHFESSVRTKPIALGYNWRPPQQAGVTVTLVADRSTYTLKRGQESRPYQGQVYLRYSPDLKHWSTWHVAKLRSVDDGDEMTFDASVGVPRSVRKPYADLLQAYSRRDDVAASWDEEAAVRWIVGREPRFFAKQLPLVGYVQVMYEGNFSGDRRVRSMNLNIGYAMSGMVQAATSREATGPGFGRHWEYVADGEDAKEVINPDP
ncbi:hypothetical protein Mal64_11410 [Pseudobythopirellula maris]|uniref:Uncharacterized protein n=1 Tax=Pseudobythopirellula maris TaxID=2527991 RepID=A0A5C5ZT71_9BACT|nr:hypothetical protein [Pseudobythopirellula maris]TWT90744.1 hypothetical protein Mal64_11410 [Pseudobythopirellula maris]